MPCTFLFSSTYHNILSLLQSVSKPKSLKLEIAQKNVPGQKSCSDFAPIFGNLYLYCNQVVVLFPLHLINCSHFIVLGTLLLNYKITSSSFSRKMSEQPDIPLHKNPLVVPILVASSTLKTPVLCTDFLIYRRHHFLFSCRSQFQTLKCPGADPTNMF